jgi:hypothetical protein
MSGKGLFASNFEVDIYANYKSTINFRGIIRIWSRLF